MAKGARLLWVGCIIALGACAKEDGGPAAPDDTTPVVNATAITTAICDHLDACAAADGALFASREACIASFPPLRLGACGAVELGNTKEEVDTCAAAVAALPCGRRFEAALDRLPSACAGLFLAGAPAVEIAEAGESCEGAKRCAANAYCELSVIDGTCSICVARAQVDEPCDSTSECEEGLFCDYVEDPAVCTEPRGSGGLCSQGNQCASGYCDPETWQCADPVALDGDCSNGKGCAGNLVCIGDICSERLPAGSTCANDGDCVLGHWCDEQRCAAVELCGSAEVGDHCLNEAGCVATAFCNSGSCAARGYSGDPCLGQDHECVSPLFCIDVEHECGPLAQAGGPCAYDDDCEPGLNCDPSGHTCTAEPACVMP